MRFLIILVVILLLGVVRRRVFSLKHRLSTDKLKSKKKSTSTEKSSINVEKKHNSKPLKSQLRTVAVFTKLSTRRFMRDKLAQFFAVLFPLIFLVVFGSLGKGSGNVSFNVALINQSNTAFSRQFDKSIRDSSTFKVSQTSTSLTSAKDQLEKNQIDGIILLPPNFGVVSNGHKYPVGQVQLIYDENSVTTGQTLTSVLQGTVKSINAKYVSTVTPLTVTGKELNQKSLSSFDYTFSGLLGFSIIGIGIFGPVNVFPELKKQGILRRLHTTPLRVWQYFMATMFSQAITGVVSIAIQFAVAIEFFGLKVDGNYLEIFIYAILSIFMILGIGLAIGGWARNERQAAPLSNIVVFPMLFLSGTFFPRFDMPVWLQHITDFLPLTPVIDGLRQLTTEGKNLTDIGPQLGLMAIWFIVIYAIAFRSFKWE